MGSSPAPPPYGVGLATLLPPKKEEKAEKKVDYLNLPCPIPFEEIQREALSESTFCFVSICFFYLDPLVLCKFCRIFYILVILITSWIERCSVIEAGAI
jgi:hypothetical protein